MIKKIILLLAILSPFILYFFSMWILKLEKKKYPVLKLSIASVILLIVALGFFRFMEISLQTLNTLLQNIRMAN